MDKSEYQISCELQNECNRELYALSETIDAFICDTKYVLDRLVTHVHNEGQIVQRHTTYNTFLQEVLRRARQLNKYLWENNIIDLLPLSNTQMVHENKCERRRTNHKIRNITEDSWKSIGPDDRHFENREQHGMINRKNREKQMGKKYKELKKRIEDLEQREQHGYDMTKNLDGRMTPEMVSNRKPQAAANKQEDRQKRHVPEISKPKNGEQLAGDMLAEVKMRELHEDGMRITQGISNLKCDEVKPEELKRRIPPENLNVKNRAQIEDDNCKYFKKVIGTDNLNSKIPAQHSVAAYPEQFKKQTPPEIINAKSSDKNEDYNALNDGPAATFRKKKLDIPLKKYSDLELTTIEAEPMESLPLQTPIQIKPITVETKHIFYGYVDSPQQQRLSWADTEVLQSLLKHPTKGSIILAHHPTDCRWYRSKILGYDEHKKMYQVFGVDFGFRETVPLSCLSKCYLNEEDVPFQALRCYIENVNDIYKFKKPEQDKSLATLRDLLKNATLLCYIEQRTVEALYVRITGIKQFS